MCIECFRLFITRHKTIWCPSKPIEDTISLRFLVDLSRRKAVLLRGGPLWKGLGGIITYGSTPLHRLSFGTLEHPRLFMSMQNVVFADLGHAVVLLLGVVVPQALVVVPASGG